MSRASPYYQVLRRNEPRQQNFAHFTKKLGAEPRHLAEDIVRDKNWAGASLLFEALNNGAPADTVIDLIRRNPEACKTKDSSGARPIAVAMRQGAQLSVIEALMAELPKSTFKGDAAGKLLMVSVRCGHGSDGVVAFWVKRFPHAARFRGGRYKELPLQAALECKRSPACIGTLLGAYSDAARHQDLAGRLPLHMAIETRAPVGIVKALFEAYPRALDLPVHNPKTESNAGDDDDDGEGGDDQDDDEEREDKDDGGGGGSEAVEASSEGLAIPWDQRGSDIRAGGATTAGDQGGAEDKGAAALGGLVNGDGANGGGGSKKRPKVRSRDPDRALHLAVRSRCSDEVVAFVLRSSAGSHAALERKDSHGRLPIHWALMQRHTGESLLRALVGSGGGETVAGVVAAVAGNKKNQNSSTFDFACAKTSSGASTLLLALENSAPEGFLLHLLFTSPAAAAVPSQRGEFPLFVAIRSMPHAVTVLQRLLAVAPSVASIVLRRAQKGLVQTNPSAHQPGESQLKLPNLAAKQKDKSRGQIEPPRKHQQQGRASPSSSSERGGLRHSAAGFSEPPPAAAEAAAVTTQTTALFEALKWMETTGGSTALSSAPAAFFGVFVSELLAATPLPLLTLTCGEGTDKLVPLHLALKNWRCLGPPNYAAKVIESLLRASPGSAGALTAFGTAPLHVALKAKAPSAIVEMLAKLRPDLAHRTSKGSTSHSALTTHTALLSSASLSCLEGARSAHDITSLARNLPQGNWAIGNTPAPRAVKETRQAAATPSRQVSSDSQARSGRKGALTRSHHGRLHATEINAPGVM